MTNQLRVFIASSSEQLPTAERVKQAIESTSELDVRVWNKGVFDF